MPRCCLILLALAPMAALRAQPVLTVSGPGGTIHYSAGELHDAPHSALTARDPHTGREHAYRGVLVRELLARAGAPLGEALRGQALQWVVIVHAADGYAPAFALAEFDPAFSDRAILLADAEDGGRLPEKEGPLRLIAPGDRKAARWARMVTALEIINPAARQVPPAAAPAPPRFPPSLP